MINKRNETKTTPANVKFKRKRSMFDGFFYQGELKNDSIVLERKHLDKNITDFSLASLENKLSTSKHRLTCLAVKRYTRDLAVLDEVISTVSKEAITPTHENLMEFVESSFDELGEGDGNAILLRKFIIIPSESKTDIKRYLDVSKEYFGSMVSTLFV